MVIVTQERLYSVEKYSRIHYTLIHNPDYIQAILFTGIRRPVLL